MMNIIEMIRNLETAFYKGEISMPSEDYEQGWESWLNGLTRSEFLFELTLHGKGN